MARQPVSLVPSPEELQEYKALDPALPGILIQMRDRELQRQFVYANRALGVAALALILVLGGFVYLVMESHPTAAGTLLGTGVLGLIAVFVRARLR